MIMSHTYLLDTYIFLQQRLDELQSTLTDTKTDQHTRTYIAGRIDAVCKMERFLSEHYDARLPRRIRKQRRP